MRAPRAWVPGDYPEPGPPERKKTRSVARSRLHVVWVSPRIPRCSRITRRPGLRQAPSIFCFAWLEPPSKKTQYRRAARADQTNLADYFFVSGLTASKRISFRNSVCRESSVFPGGNLLTLSVYARMSAFCCRFNFPGAFCGMVLRILSNKSPSVSPFQLDKNAPPVSGGADSPPAIASPWQVAHSL